MADKANRYMFTNSQCLSKAHVGRASNGLISHWDLLPVSQALAGRLWVRDPVAGSEPMPHCPYEEQTLWMGVVHCSPGHPLIHTRGQPGQQSHPCMGGAGKLADTHSSSFIKTTNKYSTNSKLLFEVQRVLFRPGFAVVSGQISTMASISAGVEDPTESAPAASGTGNVDAEGFEETISIDELGGGKRKLVRLSSGRGVLLLSHGGEVFATDHACYHHGGPLATGDIGTCFTPQGSWSLCIVIALQKTLVITPASSARGTNTSSRSRQVRCKLA